MKEKLSDVILIAVFVIAVMAFFWLLMKLFDLMGFWETAMKEPVRCPWCGHEICLGCNEDTWPALHDGCCQCGSQAMATHLGASENRRKERQA